MMKVFQNDFRTTLDLTSFNPIVIPQGGVNVGMNLNQGVFTQQFNKFHLEWARLHAFFQDQSTAAILSMNQGFVKFMAFWQGANIKYPQLFTPPGTPNLDGILERNDLSFLIFCPSSTTQEIVVDKIFDYPSSVGNGVVNSWWTFDINSSLMAAAANATNVLIWLELSGSYE
jgi:hypothetical protein